MGKVLHHGKGVASREERGTTGKCCIMGRVLNHGKGIASWEASGTMCAISPARKKDPSSWLVLTTERATKPWNPTALKTHVN